MPPPVEDAHDAEAFARGVDRSAEPGGLLHHLFGARSLALTGTLAPAAGPSYLSGLVIGHEVRAAAEVVDRPGPVTLVGAAPLVDRYAAVLDRLGRPHRRAAPDAAARGLARLARLVRPIGPP
jgi:2-dehydro-3-deoxygalactonokinase